MIATERLLSRAVVERYDFEDGIGVLSAGIICAATGAAWGAIAVAIGFLIGLAMLIYAGVKYNR